jgi:hypothetical protein
VLLSNIRKDTITCPETGKVRVFCVMAYKAIRPILKFEEILADYSHDDDDEYLRIGYDTRKRKRDNAD